MSTPTSRPPMSRPLDSREGRRLYGVDPQGYSAGRPDYPGGVYEVLASAGLGEGCRVLEVGPGSGLVTRHLLDAGANVTAVEANADMAAHLRAEFTERALNVVHAPFEEAQLPLGAFDLAVAATSFHWVEQPAGWQNLNEVLRPGAQAVIWWMLFEDPTALNEFDTASRRILGGSPSLPADSETIPFQMDAASRIADLANAGFVDVRAQFIRWTYRLRAEQVRALYATMAIVLRRPAVDQAEVPDAIERLVLDQFGGQVERTFLTTLYQGRKPL
jgi:SAM-dependent methyltransferase